MKLFELDDQGTVKVNGPWIKLIPELNALFDKRTQNTKMRWDKDTMGVKRLTYIYFMLDYGSPLMNWEDDKKHSESLKYCGLENTDVQSQVVLDALSKYESLQYEMCRPLKSLRAAYKGLDAMDTYLNDVNFKATDKMGKLLYTPNQFIGNITIINKAYDELKKLEKKIEEEMTNSSSIRGKATMGDREMKYSKPRVHGDADWNEHGSENKTATDTTPWTELTRLLGDAGKDEEEEIIEPNPLDNDQLVEL
jgi:hypothetical protein